MPPCLDPKRTPCAFETRISWKRGSGTSNYARASVQYGPPQQYGGQAIVHHSPWQRRRRGCLAGRSGFYASSAVLGDRVRDIYRTRPMLASGLPAYLRRGPGLSVDNCLLQISSLTHGCMRGTPGSSQGSAKDCCHARRQISSRLYYVTILQVRTPRVSASELRRRPCWEDIGCRGQECSE